MFRRPPLAADVYFFFGCLFCNQNLLDLAWIVLSIYFLTLIYWISATSAPISAIAQHCNEIRKAPLTAAYVVCEPWGDPFIVSGTMEWHRAHDVGGRGTLNASRPHKSVQC